MSWLRLGGALDRLSPFTRSPTQGPATVSDADYSYITNDDLKRQAAHAADESRENSKGNQGREPHRDTDTLTIKDNGKEHTIHFPAYSIANGELSVKDVRHAAGKKLGVDPARLRLMYRGKPLRTDKKLCRAEGLLHRDSIICSVHSGDQIGASDSEFDDDDAEDTTQVDTQKKKKRTRNTRSKKKRNNDADADTLSVPQISQARAPSPGSSTPLTAKAKLTALRATLQSYDRDVQSFLRHPPADTAKRDFEHKRLSETILTQVLLKIDAVETEGDLDARAQRKELVKDTQAILKTLDDA